MKKKKNLGENISNFGTFTRHSGVQMKSNNKKVLGGNCLFKLSKGAILKKSLVNLSLKALN